LTGGSVTVERIDEMTGNPRLIKIQAPGSLVQGSFIQQAMQFVQVFKDVLGLAPTQSPEFEAPPAEQRTNSGAVAVHLQQKYKGIPIFQAAQTVRFTPGGALSETAGTTVTVSREVSALPGIRVEDAVLQAAEHVAKPTADELTARDPFGQRFATPSIDLANFRPAVSKIFIEQPEQPTLLSKGPFANEISASLVWFPLEAGLRLAWEVLLTMPEHAGQFRVLVDAGTGEILYARNLIQAAAAQGNVYHIDGDAERQMVDFPIPYQTYGLRIPADLSGTAPPDWVVGNDTSGFSVVAHLNDDFTQVLRGSLQSNKVVFNPPDPNGDQQKILNMFYLSSVMHDFFYLLGFREADGNFQRPVPDRPGQPAGADPVDARAFSGTVWGTANFVTPADGQSPTMNMGLVESTGRHTAFDATVVFHEYVHGVSNRLVGGPTDTRSLETPQSRGMGEGWGDYFACTITSRPVVAAWVTGMAGGIRGFPYNNFPAATQNFGKLGTGRYTGEHAIGEIWCATLMDMTRNLNVTQGVPAGTQLALQLVVDAMKLSPTNPSFLDMRDAILTAWDNEAMSRSSTPDATAAVRRDIWQAFAKYGMGPGARSNGGTLAGIVTDFNVPQDLPTRPVDGQQPAVIHVEAKPALAIPDNNPTGISSPIAVTAPGTVVGITVTVDITHSYIGDLQLALMTPTGRVILLHDRAGGDYADLRATYRLDNTPGLSGALGEQLTGNWILGVRDIAAKDIGTLNRWSLDLGSGQPLGALGGSVAHHRYGFH
jgi:extracellular elastinolytic metalloproteinase